MKTFQYVNRTDFAKSRESQSSSHQRIWILNLLSWLLFFHFRFRVLSKSQPLTDNFFVGCFMKAHHFFQLFSKTQNQRLTKSKDFTTPILTIYLSSDFTYYPTYL
jgi:hypothetical protein